MPSASVRVHSVLLSGVAGYVDAAGFASLVGLFPAHLTGELVDEAIALSSSRPAHGTHLWILPVFGGSVVFASLVARILRRRGRRPLAGLLALVTAALALFSASDALSQLFHASGRVPMLLGAGCAVAAMGFQNALMREALITSCPTTVMTGNVTAIVIDLADRAFSKIMRPSPLDRRPRSGSTAVPSAFGAFLGCAVIGGFLTRTVGTAGGVLPTAAAAVLMIWTLREDRARLPLSRPSASLGPARMPTIDSPQVWPESRLPRGQYRNPLGSIPEAPLNAVSVTQLRTAPVLPPPASEAPGTPVTHGEKRTISGTQLAQRYRDAK